MKVKPIETYYKGFRFRSRAEARWAVFFDECKIKYMYEPEGLQLSDGTLYLPDFYLPESKTYFEVKGIMNDMDMHKIEQLQKDLCVSVAIGYADMTFQASNQQEGAFNIADRGDSYFVKCYECNKYYFIGEIGSYSCLNCGYYDGNATFLHILYGDLWNYKDESFKPLEKALQARFEHGEHGWR